MNSSHSVPLPHLIATALWAAVAISLLVCWHGWWTQDIGQAQVGGFTAAALVGPATVAHIRLYTARVCAVIRAIQVPPDDRVPLRQL